MRSLAIRKYCKPELYEIMSIEDPQIEDPGDLLIKVHAASINPVDVKVASGVAKMVQTDIFPYKIGHDLSGTVLAVGREASSQFKPGDEVYTLVPERCRGTVSELAISSVSATARKPHSLSHNQAASIPLVSLTALQALDIADMELEGGLKGKTVYIPGGLSGTGSMAIQLARNVFGVGKIITTLSTSKILKAEEILGAGVLDQVIDYTKESPTTIIPRGSVDFMFDTMGGAAMASLCLMKQGGVIVSISSLPFGPDLKRAVPDMPLVARWALNALGWVAQYRASRYKVKYSCSLARESGPDLERLATWLDQEKIKPVVGRVTNLSDLQGIRDGCSEVFTGKGGIGKFVIDIDGSA